MSALAARAARRRLVEAPAVAGRFSGEGIWRGWGGRCRGGDSQNCRCRGGRGQGGRHWAAEAKAVAGHGPDAHGQKEKKALTRQTKPGQPKKSTNLGDEKKSTK